MNKTLLAHIFLFVANLIYALNYTIAKDVMPNYIEPSGFILLRVVGAVVLFSLYYLFFIKEKVENIDILLLSVCGLFGVAINQLLFLYLIAYSQDSRGYIVEVNTKAPNFSIHQFSKIPITVAIEPVEICLGP